MKWASLFLWGAILLVSVTAAADTVHELDVLAPEHKVVTDPQTGAELRFLTTSPEADTNLYFHQRSWFSDGSVILFVSKRPGGGLMGYLPPTGEIFAFEPDAHNVSATAGINRPCVFVARKDGDLVEITLDIALSQAPDRERSKVTAHERVLCKLPAFSGFVEVNESCDGKYVAVGNTSWAHMNGPGIVLVDEQTGQVRDLCTIPKDLQYGGHLQWSHTDPNMLSFAAIPVRLWFVDIRDGVPHNPYKERPNELVTHESWWVNDQLLFCGGTHPKPTEEAHVKVLDTHTGEVRIVGAGAWWPGGTDAEIARVNWWHSDGSDDGRWVVADNWYGDIMLFEGATTRERLLTGNHRTYGKGDHPHVGFDRASKQVVFTSSQLGNSDVCVATIPEAWQQGNATPAVKP